MIPNTTVRVNITIPKDIWHELEKEVPQRKKSSFISKAIEEKLRVKKRKKAFAELASLPPTFADIFDGAGYVHALRRREDETKGQRITK